MIGDEASVSETRAMTGSLYRGSDSILCSAFGAQDAVRQALACLDGAK